MKYRLHPLFAPAKPPEKPPTRRNVLKDEESGEWNRNPEGGAQFGNPCACGCGQLTEKHQVVKGYRKACYARAKREGRFDAC